MDDLEVKKIIHIDMDAFYAAVEQRDFPEYRNKAIAVGGDKDRGVVATASYEARKFGVRSAMASSIAKEKCPRLVFVRPRFQVYKEVSKQIREIFHEYTDLVEPLSLDEAYLDVTYNKKGIQYATEIAKAIRKDIEERTGLTASAGISYNKFLAKTASDINKPNGWKVILPEEAEEFLEALKIEKFHGIGRKTAQRMHQLGINTGKDLKRWDKEKLTEYFGKSGNYYFNIVRGLDTRVVNPTRIRKSISAERTFSENLRNYEDVFKELMRVAEILKSYIEKAKTKSGHTITLKIRYSDFSIISKSITKEKSITEVQQIKELAEELLDKVDLEDKEIRLIGLRLSNLDNDDKEELEEAYYKVKIKNSNSHQLTLDFT
jgi:DNA polymerase-4